MTNNLRRLYIIRALSVLASLQIMAGFISPSLWVLQEQASIVSKVAMLSVSSQALAVCWIVSAIAISPFVVMQIFSPDHVHRRVIIKIANFGMIAGATIWMFMASLSRNLDYEFAVWNFLFNAFAALAMVALLANSLNNDQKEKAKRKGFTYEA